MLAFSGCCHLCADQSDCNLGHGSGHNSSPLPRKTFIVAYNDIANKPEPVEKPRPDWVVAREFEVVR